MPAKKSDETQTTQIDDEKYYDVLVTEGFEYKKVKFGVVSKTHVSGEFLRDLLSSEHSSKIAAHSERE